MGNAIRLSISLFLFLLGTARQQELQMASVQIVIVDGMGRHLEKPEVSSFIETDTGKNYASLFNDGQASVPFGDYVLKVHSTGFFTGERHLQVFQPEVSIIVALEPGAESRVASPLIHLTGKLLNVSSAEKPVYLHLSGLYLDFQADTALNDANQFCFTGRIPTGKFVLTTTGRTGILDIRWIENPTTKPLLVHLDRTHCTQP
jgi:hypothetical protein